MKQHRDRNIIILVGILFAASSILSIVDININIFVDSTQTDDENQNENQFQLILLLTSQATLEFDHDVHLLDCKRETGVHFSF